MRKSYAYRLAQISVLNNPNLSNVNKLFTLRILFEDEDLAKFAEEQEEKEKTDEIF